MSVHPLIMGARCETDPGMIAPSLVAEPVGVEAVVGRAVSYGERYALWTRGVAPAFFDVTDLVRGGVRRSGIHHGQALTATAHTTCALLVQENEPLLLADLAERLCRFASSDEAYRHNEMDRRLVNVCGPEECANGHSHCQHALLGASITLPVRERDIVLGRWQRLLLVELDHPRPRELTLHVIGVAPREVQTAATAHDASSNTTMSEDEQGGY
jgi:secondary thiamine-phosphate synthase enzyme